MIFIKNIGLFNMVLLRGRTPTLPGFFLAVSVGVVLAANTPGSAALSIGIGSFFLAAACLRVGQGFSNIGNLILPTEQRLLVGIFALAYFLSFPVKLFHASILIGAILFCAVALIPRRFGRNNDVPEEVAFFLSCAAAIGFALIWSLESSQRLASFAKDGIFRLWLDFFIHAGIISEFGDIRTIGRINAELADTPGYFYHFASYALPGLAVRLTDMSALISTTAIWIPLGILATAFAVFALGRAIAGMIGGALSILLLAAAPDPASYGLHQGFLSFHWMLDAEPGSLYGLPCACLSLAILVTWCRTAQWRALACSAVILAAVFLLRAQIFMWCAPPWVAVCVAGLPNFTTFRKTLILAIGLLVGIFGMLIIGHAEIAQIGLPQYMVQYVELLHMGSMDPTGYGGLDQLLIQKLGHLVALGPGLMLAYFGMGGIPLLTFLLGGLIAWYAGRLRNFDIFPFALLIWAGALMLFAPSPANLDSTEFRERGFVLCVAVLLCWNARWLTMLCEGRASQGRTVLPTLAALAALAVLPISSRYVAVWKEPVMNWGKLFRSTPVSPGIISAAKWLRNEASPGSVFTVAKLDTKAMIFDDAIAIMGLSGSNAWVSRIPMQQLLGPIQKYTANTRIFELEQLSQAHNFTTVKDALLQAKVSYYVVIGPMGPTWDISATQAAFHTGDCTIYRIDDTLNK